jgi:hypothetical protein
MSFLNWILLGGMAVFAAPLIIHLLNRTRFKVVDWGAMHLLDAALQVNSQRLQWQSLLLLIIRCLIPILLAICLARPVFTGWRSAGGAGDKSLVVLIDNSISMEAIDAQGTTRFEQAVQQVQTLVDQQAPATELSLWTIGGRPVDVLNGTTFDHRRVANKLKSLSVGAGSVPVQSALAAGLKQVAGMQNASREIIVISDFQNHEWQAFGESERDAYKQQVAAESLPVHLTFLPIRDQGAATNLSVAIDALEQPLVVVDQVFRIASLVRNHGPKPAEDVAVVLNVAGTEIASRRLSIPSGGVTQAVFDCQIESPGTHVIAVRIDDAAGFAGDNISNQIVSVRTPLRVLILDKQAAAPELQRASGYLSLALSPFQANDVGKNFLLTSVVSPEQLGPNATIDHDVLVLADAPRLSDSIADEIADFVVQGGGLLMFSSQTIDVNWYNSRWGSAAKTPLLPGEYASQVKPSGPAVRIANEPSTHAALSLVSQPGSDDFASVEIQSSHNLKLVASSAAPSNDSRDSSDPLAQVLLDLETGYPLLLAKPFGQGHVMQFATAADTSGSNLPLRPIYVPLMHSLVQWLATGLEPNRNASTGEVLAIRFPTKVLREDKRSADPPLAMMTLPDRSEVELQLDASGQSNFSETAFPGVYSVAFSDDLHGENNLVERFAVNAPSDESQWQFLSVAQLNELATATGASVVVDAQELLRMQSVRANGREVWRWFLLALVALLFAELWWQQRIARGSL